MSKKFLKIVMSLMLALAVVPSIALAEDEKATELTSTTATDGTLSGGSYILKNDVTLTKDLTIAENTTVTIDLNGYTLTGTGTASVITVNGVLTIKDTSDDADGKITNGVTYNGNGVGYGVDETSSSFPTVNGGGISVLGYGTLNLVSGSISNNIVGQCYGAGVYVDTNATFNMSGGSISDNYTVCCGTNITSNKVAGGGVYNAGKFDMSGGTISRNKLIWWNGTSSYDVGAHGAGICNTGTFNMSGGSITSNVTGAHGAGIYSSGNSGYVTITGGEISNNDATAKKDLEATLSSSDSKPKNYLTKSNQSGGGIYMEGGTLNISGGSIENNVSYGSGGGIMANNATVEISGSALIDSNTSEDDGGGGIYLIGTSTMSMSGGTISNNSTPNGSGGGVWVNSTSTFSMSGGTISYNSVGTSTNGKKAAGVGVYGGVFTMTGGTISDNYTYTGTDTVTNGYGAGIWVGDGAGTVTINGGSVYGNTARWGAGIASEGGTVEITSGVVANNTATLYASDIYAGASGSTYTTLTISDDVNGSTTYEAGTMNLTIDGWYVDGGTDEDEKTIRYSDGTDEVLESANYTDKYTFTTSATEEESDDDSEDLATDSDASTSNPTEYTITNGTTLTETVYLIAAHGIGYKVTYNDNVEDEVVFEDQVTYVKSGSAVPDFEGSTARTGYTFLGWSLDGSTVIDLSTMTISEDVIFYAVWEEVPATDDTSTDDTSTDDTENTDETDDTGTTEDTDNTDSGSDIETTDDTETGDTGTTDESGNDIDANVDEEAIEATEATGTSTTSSETEESADTDTSDHTVMYIYALVGLTAACGAYYVARKKEDL